MTPRDEADLAEAIAGGGSFRVTGGATRGMAARSGANGEISTQALTGISLYEPGALTLVAGAGTPVAEVEATLAAEGQQLAFEPMDHRMLLGTKGAPTIGGMTAANISGPRRIQAGACRDSMLGVRFVDGAGMVVKNGGRVMKNVTGYDLVKLMAGSYGTLGVLTEVSLKVLPKPEAAATCLIEGLSDVDAVAAMSAALTSPYDVTGAAHLQRGLDGTPVTMIRVEGFADSVTYRATQLKDRLGRFGDISIEADAERVAAGWRYIRDVEPFAGRAGDVWRVSVKPSDGPAVAAAAGGEAMFDWGGGLVWLLLPEGTDLRDKLAGIAGHATLVRGNGMPMLQPQPAAVAAIEAGLRQSFDPDGRLNPGLMGQES